MIIDFHTHVFPEKIAKKTIEFLAKACNQTPFLEGTIDDLERSMKEAGVDVSVVLPVVTKPTQFASINEYARELNKREKIISFGGIHPDSSDYKKEMDEIIAWGFKGIKLHPDYQGTFIDDEKNIQIIQYAIDHGLHVVIHAGVDVGFPEPVHCPPRRALKMLERLEHLDQAKGKVILAHVGGHALWDEVEKYLVGKEVYFDLAFDLGKIPDQQLLRIIENHGEDKILFATDSPWNEQKGDVAYLRGLALGEETRNRIFAGNAQRLLEL